MSEVQWLGIWAMTGVSKAEKSDLSKWVASVRHLLEDTKGLDHFKKFIKEDMKNSENIEVVVAAWESIHKLQNEG
jgi:hypothetical protein